MDIEKEMIVKILNKIDNEDAYIYLSYDNHEKIKSVSARIYMHLA